MADFLYLFALRESRGRKSMGKMPLYPSVIVGLPQETQFDFLYTNFSHNYPPISIPFLKEKHPILLKLGAFYHNLLKIHPIHVILGSFISDENPPIAKFCEIAPQKAGTYIRIPCQFENPSRVGYMATKGGNISEDEINRRISKNNQIRKEQGTQLGKIHDKIKIKNRMNKENRSGEWG